MRCIHSVSPPGAARPFRASDTGTQALHVTFASRGPNTGLVASIRARILTRERPGPESGDGQLYRRIYFIFAVHDFNTARWGPLGNGYMNNGYMNHDKEGTGVSGTSRAV
jgi:hypothetical protein